jgi:hypothetical protein
MIIPEGCRVIARSSLCLLGDAGEFIRDCKSVTEYKTIIWIRFYWCGHKQYDPSMWMALRRSTCQNLIWGSCSYWYSMSKESCSPTSNFILARPTLKGQIFVSYHVLYFWNELIMCTLNGFPRGRWGMLHATFCWNKFFTQQMSGAYK